MSQKTLDLTGRDRVRRPEPAATLQSLEGISATLSPETLGQMIESAVSCSDLRMFHWLIANGADPLAHQFTPVDEDSETSFDSRHGRGTETENCPLLVRAVGRGDVPMVEALLSVGADPNQESSWPTPLEAWMDLLEGRRIPTQEDKRRIAELLLAAGADPNRPPSRAGAARLGFRRHIEKRGSAMERHVLAQYDADRLHQTTAPARASVGPSLRL